jgi:hypothetical protein
MNKSGVQRAKKRFLPRFSYCELHMMRLRLAGMRDFGKSQSAKDFGELNLLG